jgi:hypothetical protein
MARFLTQPELYLLLARELPDDVYPFSANPADYWHTADLAAHAEAIKNAYDAMEVAYNNYWPQTADEEGIAHHEIARFGDLSIGLTLQARRDRVLAKMRSMPSLSKPDLKALVEAELPTGTLVQLVGWNQYLAGGGVGGTWYLGVSQLGVDTYLGAYGSHAYPPGADLCEEDGSELGMTAQEWADYQAQAYTFEVRIYAYTATADELAAIDRVLLEAEAARSQHVIRNNVGLDEYVGAFLPPMEVIP